MIKGGGIPKHGLHICNAADIPAAYILIEGGSIPKHAVHSCNATDIPAAYILIEGGRAAKHFSHICNAADIPAAYILIEGEIILKHFVHTANAAGAGRGGDGEVRSDLGKRPFGIFGSTHCTLIANGGIGTENGHPIAMEGKEQPTVIFAFSIYRRVARVTAGATLYITIAIGAALAWRAVGAGIDRASASSPASIAAGAVRKAKDRDREQDREGTEKVRKAAEIVGKKARGAFFTI